MSQSNNTFAGSLNANFKQTYAKDYKELIPEGQKLMKLIPWLSKDRMPGNYFNQMVVLGMEHGKRI